LGRTPEEVTRLPVPSGRSSVHGLGCPLSWMLAVVGLLGHGDERRVLISPCLGGSLAPLAPNASGEPRPAAAARNERRLLGVGFRVEPVVTQPAPPQTRTCAMNAYGSSVTRVSGPLWRITLLPCKLDQLLWTILGMGKG
jgi:hypothetical protein